MKAKYGKHIMKEAGCYKDGGTVEAKKDGGPVEAKKDGGSVAPPLKKKDGGEIKVSGRASGGRADKFARGGRTGSDKNPFSSAKIN